MKNQWEDGKMGEQKIFGFLSCVFGWRGGKVEGWRTFLFDQREKGEDGKYNLYKLTIMSLLYNIYKKQIYLHSLNNIKINTKKLNAIQNKKKKKKINKRQQINEEYNEDNKQQNGEYNKDKAPKKKKKKKKKKITWSTRCCAVKMLKKR